MLAKFHNVRYRINDLLIYLCAFLTYIIEKKLYKVPRCNSMCFAVPLRWLLHMSLFNELQENILFIKYIISQIYYAILYFYLVSNIVHNNLYFIFMFTTNLTVHTTNLSLSCSIHKSCTKTSKYFSRELRILYKAELKKNPNSKRMHEECFGLLGRLKYPLPAIKILSRVEREESTHNTWSSRLNRRNS